MLTYFIVFFFNETLHFFLNKNIGGNKKWFPPFQVRFNDAVTEQSLPRKFGASLKAWDLVPLCLFAPPSFEKKYAL